MHSNIYIIRDTLRQVAHLSVRHFAIGTVSAEELVRPCLTSLDLVESVHGHHSTKLIGHLPLINQYKPTFNVAGTS